MTVLLSALGPLHRQLIVALLVLNGSALLSTAHAASATATVSATIVKPISLNTESGLSFDEVAADSSAGTVVLNPDGSRQAAGGASIKASQAGVPARFQVQGEANAVFTVSLPESAVLTDSAGNQMLVNRFTSQSGNLGITDAKGQQTLNVGATLNVEGNQAVGPYTGTMQVTIDYN